MTYVPGCQHDLFLSYAHDDDPVWIKAFREGLCRRLREQLGHEVAVWQDANNLRLGQNWVEEIEDALRHTAALVAICSPGYFNSLWCRRERNFFLGHYGGLGGVKAGSFYRFLKVVKTPAESQAHLHFFPELQYVPFFREAEDGPGEIEFDPGSDDFRARIRETAQAVAALLRAMRRSREAVFVATPADDATGACVELVNELHDQGFNVRPEEQLDGSFSDKFIREQIEPARLAVFLLAASYEDTVRRQLDLAKELRKSLVFWLHAGAEQAGDARQAELLRSIRNGEGLGPGFVLLDRASSRDLIQEVLDLLRPRPVAPVPTNGAESRVYLLYDTTTREDNAFVGRLRDILRERKLTVFLPQTGAIDVTDRLQRHRQFLHDCDGVLVYRGAAPPPDRWLLQALQDVLFAEDQLNRDKIAAKTFLLADPSPARRFEPNIQVIPRPDDLAPVHLQSFFDSLRQAKGGNAGH